MKRSVLIPILSLVGGIAAFALRLLQNRTGFEAATGLPVPGNVPGLTLIACFVLLAVVLLVLSRRLPPLSEDSPAFPDVFAAENSSALFLPVAGILLMALSGAADLYEGITGNALIVQLKAAADPYSSVVEEVTGLEPRLQLALGALTLLGAIALLVPTLACRKQTPEAAEPSEESPEAPAPVNGSLLLIFPVVLVVRLVLIYRLDSIDPALAAYYVEILALVFLTLAFYRLSSFAFCAGKPALFTWYAGLAIVFSLAALADGGPHLSSLLLYAGGAVTLLGFLLLRRSAAHP